MKLNLNLNLNLNSNLYQKKENNLKSAIVPKNNQKLEKLKKLHAGSAFSKRTE
jgi:hypothetical protein